MGKSDPFAGEYRGGVDPMGPAPGRGYRSGGTGFTGNRIDYYEGEGPEIMYNPWTGEESQTRPVYFEGAAVYEPNTKQAYEYDKAAESLKYYIREAEGNESEEFYDPNSGPQQFGVIGGGSPANYPQNVVQFGNVSGHSTVDPGTIQSQFEQVGSNKPEPTVWQNIVSGVQDVTAAYWAQTKPTSMFAPKNTNSGIGNFGGMAWQVPQGYTLDSVLTRYVHEFLQFQYPLFLILHKTDNPAYLDTGVSALDTYAYGNIPGWNNVPFNLAPFYANVQGMNYHMWTVPAFRYLACIWNNSRHFLEFIRKPGWGLSVFDQLNNKWYTQPYLAAGGPYDYASVEVVNGTFRYLKDMDRAAFNREFENAKRKSLANM